MTALLTALIRQYPWFYIKYTVNTSINEEPTCTIGWASASHLSSTEAVPLEVTAAAGVAVPAIAAFAFAAAVAAAGSSLGCTPGCSCCCFCWERCWGCLCRRLSWFGISGAALDCCCCCCCFELVLCNGPPGASTLVMCRVSAAAAAFSIIWWLLTPLGISTTPLMVRGHCMLVCWGCAGLVQ